MAPPADDRTAAGRETDMGRWRTTRRAEDDAAQRGVAVGHTATEDDAADDGVTGRGTMTATGKKPGAWPAPAAPGAGRPATVMDSVVELCGRGTPPLDIARRLRLPVPFVRQIIDVAAAQGRLDMPEWRDACASGSCSPDPQSLVCAGCPFRPR